jgi:hypothetical protein
MNWRERQKLDKLLSVLCDAQFACGKFRFEHENALIDDETYHKLWVSASDAQTAVESFVEELTAKKE